jgi:hypothetical protein
VVSIEGQKVSLGQANGPDVELVVTGTELYATYQTPDGFPAVYDDSLGLFCFARLDEGQLVSTGVPVTATPPPDLERNVEESSAVRTRKIAERREQMERRSHPKSLEQNISPEE